MDIPEVLRWETLSKKRFDQIDRERAVVLVTCSPLEVHGPHLPLGADCFEGEALSERMLLFLPEDQRDRIFLKLPFLDAASDPISQPGSIGFRVSTILAAIGDLGRSLAAQGFEHVIVSNFHGSPRHFLAIETACARV
jgi:creatinine amidohydrolase